MHQRRSGKTTTFNAATPDSDAQRDRARIIHSSAFRRLQAKTQVLGVGESDFYRTRLTHSMEVAQIGSGICEKLKQKYAEHDAISTHIPSYFQIEAICLAHDIGHPPFGHGGEVALNYHMHSSGGFEGNGQTLRIISKLGEYSDHDGLDLTRRTLLGVLKYPVLHREVSTRSLSAVDHLDAFKPPKSIHDDEQDVLDWILEPLTSKDKATFRATKTTKGKTKAQYKAFDTSIMELADDISYGVHDLEDSLALNLVTERQWREDVLNKVLNDSIIAKNADFYTKKLFSGESKLRKHSISLLIGHFVPCIEVVEQKVFESPWLDLQAELPEDIEHTLQVLKDFVFKHVIRSSSVQVLEYKGQMMIFKLFQVLSENPERLLPESTLRKYKNTDNRERVICDYISGMTDNYATKLYSKLFSPDTGSVFDKV